MQLTNDHSVAMEHVRRGALLAEEVRAHVDRSTLTRSGLPATFQAATPSVISLTTSPPSPSTTKSTRRRQASKSRVCS